MVDAIKNTVSRLDLQKARPGDTRNAPSAPAQASTAAAPKGSVKVSDAASVKAVAQMAETPPIDGAAVRRIKEAIARGEYPINVDRISDALMHAYREMKG
jgi:negative regulator of flagellin synthesis FlgM